MKASDLTGDWYRSTEEEHSGRVVYRGPTYDFPPVRRARPSVRLKPDGTAAFGVAGPADRTEESPGRWELEGDVLRLVGAGGSEEFVIESLGDEVMVLTPR